jgi:16S rRNA G966 N2-methylase RsmD
MDFTISNPNIISYNILNKYIKNKNNFDYFNNLILIDDNYFYNNINDENDVNNNIINNNFNNNNINNNIINNEDVWDSAINDDKFYINNKIARIFHILKNYNNYSKIKIDEDSFSYITIREIAIIISKIICYHLLEYNLNPQKISIIDYTSGVGGNVLSFCKFFNYVYAIELDQLRSEYLENNINIYGYKNIKVINDCALKFNDKELIILNPNVIFIDPPWGGSNYKNSSNLTLTFGKIKLEEFVINIVKIFSIHYIDIIKKNSKDKQNNNNNKFIILKLPKNYDIEYFYNYIKLYNNFINFNISSYLYILNKMIIIVCELQYKYE